jgi:hypothetical protein
MHDFFRPRDVSSVPFEIPQRMYALLIDSEDREHAFFDGVDAQSFDAVPSLAIPVNWDGRAGPAPSCTCGRTLNPTQQI